MGAAAIAVLTATTPAGAAARCTRWGRPAVAADPKPGALRVFAIQLRQEPAAMATAAAYRRAIDCAVRREVLPRLARNRPNLVVFDEDVGLEAIATGSRGAAARALLRHPPPCGPSPCQTLGALSALNTGYGRALAYLGRHDPALNARLGKAFVAATDTFVRVFMTTMSDIARRDHVYVIASNTQAPFALTHDPAAIRALRGGGTSAYAPTAGVAYDQTFVWGPRDVHPGMPAPEANLLAVNRKVPLTGFEQALGFAPGPARGAAARRNLEPIAIPGTKARIGLATSLPAFTYGSASKRPCADIATTYMRCLDALGANVVIQADANDGAWAAPAASGTWQPLEWMGSAWRAVTDPTVGFTYAVNPFLVGNLADTPFDGQSAVLQRGLRGSGCHYVGDAAASPQFLALAPWVVPDAPRATLQRTAARLTAGTSAHPYVQTALVADLPFPADPSRRGCVKAGR